MATFHFDLVSPEKLLFSGEVDQVDVPGSEGDFGVLAGHAPLVATLRPGVLVIYRDGGELRIVVNGGFAEVGPAGLTVLAEMAVPLEEFDPRSARRRDQGHRGGRRRRHRRLRRATSSPTSSLSSRRCRPRWGRKTHPVSTMSRGYFTGFANFANSFTTRS